MYWWTSSLRITAYFMKFFQTSRKASFSMNIMCLAGRSLKCLILIHHTVRGITFNSRNYLLLTNLRIKILLFTSKITWFNAFWKKKIWIETTIVKCLPVLMYPLSAEICATWFNKYFVH